MVGFPNDTVRLEEVLETFYILRPFLYFRVVLLYFSQESCHPILVASLICDVFTFNGGLSAYQQAPQPLTENQFMGIKTIAIIMNTTHTHTHTYTTLSKVLKTRL